MPDCSDPVKRRNMAILRARKTRAWAQELRRWVPDDGLLVTVIPPTSMPDQADMAADLALSKVPCTPAPGRL